MIVYPTVGTPIEYQTDGSNRAVRSDPVQIGTTTMALVTALESSREVTRKGISRFVLKFSSKLPGALMSPGRSSYVAEPGDGTGSPMSVHLVVTMPAILAQAEIGQASTASNGAAALRLLERWLCEMFTIVGGVSQASNSGLVVTSPTPSGNPYQGDNPVTRGLLGAAPYNVINGTYGQATAGS